LFVAIRAHSYDRTVLFKLAARIVQLRNSIRVSANGPL
jgi:hypothetical protein